MIIDYNKSMGGVDRLDQFRRYYDVGRAGKKFLKYICYTYYNIVIIKSFICFKNSKSPTHAILYYLIKMPYYMSLLILTLNPYPFLFWL